MKEEEERAKELQRQLAETKERLLGFSSRLREARKWLAERRAALKPLRERVAEREAEVRAEVQMEPGDQSGKLRYTNDAARTAEVKARLAKDVAHRSLSEQLARADAAVSQAEVDLQAIEDERTALKWYLDATVAEVQLATFQDPTAS